MATGKVRALRLHALQQASLVWCLDDVDKAEYLRCGSMPKQKETPLDPNLQEAVNQKLDEFKRTGKLVIDG